MLGDLARCSYGYALWKYTFSQAFADAILYLFIRRIRLVNGPGSNSEQDFQQSLLSHIHCAISSSGGRPALGRAGC